MQADSSQVEELAGQVSVQRDALPTQLEPMTARVAALEADMARLLAGGERAEQQPAQPTPEAPAAPDASARPEAPVEASEATLAGPSSMQLHAIADLQQRLEEVEAMMRDKLEELQQALESIRQPPAPTPTADTGVGSAAAGSPVLSPRGPTPQQLPHTATLTRGATTPRLGPGDLDALRAQVTDLSAQFSELAAALDRKADKDELAVLSSAAAEAPTRAALESSNAVNAVAEMAEALEATAADGQPRAVDLGPVLAALRALDKALAGKADAERLGAVERAVAGKASSDRLADLELGMAGKADRSGIDELRLRVMMLASGDAGEQGSLLEQLQALLVDKAGKQEVELLQVGGARGGGRAWQAHPLASHRGGGQGVGGQA